MLCIYVSLSLENPFPSETSEVAETAGIFPNRNTEILKKTRRRILYPYLSVLCSYANLSIENPFPSGASGVTDTPGIYISFPHVLAHLL